MGGPPSQASEKRQHLRFWANWKEEYMAGTQERMGQRPEDESEGDSGAVQTVGGMLRVTG